MRILLHLAVFVMLGAAEQASGFKLARPYESHYLVGGFRDAAGVPVMVAADVNRTELPGGRAAYEYKLFVGRGGDWSMPVYERWEADDGGYPARGLSVDLAADLAARVRADAAGVVIETGSPDFAFVAEKHGVGTIRTAHVAATLTVGGETARVTMVHEHVRYEPAEDRGRRVNTEEAAEAGRSLGGDGVFGRYDWAVLYDDDGRLYQVSSGTRTEDFAYGPAGEAHDVEVRWLRTRDVPGGPATPVVWQLDVPGWGFRGEVRADGEHEGRGGREADGWRPVYRQVGVGGRAVIGGRPTRLFGMVEHIGEARTGP